MHANTKIKTSFEHFKKSIEESNTLLGQKKDSLIRASNEFMSSTVYCDPDINEN